MTVGLGACRIGGPGGYMPSGCVGGSLGGLVSVALLQLRRCCGCVPIAVGSSWAGAIPFDTCSWGTVLITSYRIKSPRSDCWLWCYRTLSSLPHPFPVFGFKEQVAMCVIPMEKNFSKGAVSRHFVCSISRVHPLVLITIAGEFRGSHQL